MNGLAALFGTPTKPKHYIIQYLGDVAVCACGSLVSYRKEHTKHENETTTLRPQLPPTQSPNHVQRVRGTRPNDANFRGTGGPSTPQLPSDATATALR